MNVVQLFEAQIVNAATRGRSAAKGDSEIGCLLDDADLDFYTPYNEVHRDILIQAYRQQRDAIIRARLPRV